MNLERKRLNLQIKSTDSSGKLAGYASVFGTVDTYGDCITPGAFAGGLGELAGEGRKMAMLWQHDQDEPIGVWDIVREDNMGLYVEGALILNQNVPNADKAYALIKNGALDGLSIGFEVQDYKYQEDTRMILKAKVWETSIVTMQANAPARITSFKSAGKMPDAREFERYLTREAGFSRSQAKAIISQGYKSLLSERDAGGDEVLDLLKSILLTK